MSKKFDYPLNEELESGFKEEFESTRADILIKMLTR